MHSMTRPFPQSQAYKKLLDNDPTDTYALTLTHDGRVKPNPDADFLQCLLGSILLLWDDILMLFLTALRFPPS